MQYGIQFTATANDSEKQVPTDNREANRIGKRSNKKNDMKKESRYDEPRLDHHGLPICEECGDSFHFLLYHVAHNHTVTSKEYKAKHRLHPKKSIMSEAMRQKKSDAYHAKYAQNVKQLAEAGKSTQFKQGNKVQSVRWEREKIKPDVSVKALIGKMAQSGGKRNDNILKGRLVTKT